MSNTEQAWRDGNRAAWVAMLNQCLEVIGHEEAIKVPRIAEAVSVERERWEAAVRMALAVVPADVYVNGNEKPVAVILRELLEGGAK